MDTKNIKALESEIKQSQKLLRSLELKKKEIISCQKDMNDIEKSIEHEKDLRKLPCQAIGSILLYNILNENYSYFEGSQFNKVTRFVDHIEEKEKRYRKLYLNCTEHYIKDPLHIPIDDLKKEQRELNMSYKLLSVLANEIKGDVVSFNKVYNKLEDTGMFMSVPEKQNQEYLSQISSKLSNVMNGLEAVFVTLQRQSEHLNEIAYNTSEMSSYLWDISWEVSNLN
jgi:hypothetical protein